METSKEKDDTMNTTHGIKVLIEGQRFESYVAWAFSRKLEVQKYNQGIKYSYIDEIIKIEEILDKENIKFEEKQQIINKLYSKLQDELKYINFQFQCSEESSSQLSSLSGRTDDKSKDKIKEKKLNNISNDIKQNTNKIDNEMVNSNIKN